MFSRRHMRQTGPVCLANVRSPYDWLDSSTLRRTASVMGNRGDVLDHCYRQANSLQGPQSGLATGTGAFDPDLNTTQTVLLGFVCRIFSGHLGSKRSTLTTPSETFRPRCAPRDDVTCYISNGNNRIVECRLNMGNSIRYILFFNLFAYTLARLGHGSSCYFFLPATVLRGPLRVLAFVLVFCPRTGKPLRWRRPR